MPDKIAIQTPQHPTVQNYNVVCASLFEMNDIKVFR